MTAPISRLPYTLTLFVLVLNSICNVTQVISQQRLAFQSFDASQGLSQNSIYSIAQTKDGFLWFGTQDGLNRFDGFKFTTFYPRQIIQKNKEFKYHFSKHINSLYSDYKGYLWVGTSNEVMLYNSECNDFLAIEEVYDGCTLPQDIFVKEIKEDHKLIYIATKNKGIIIYDKQKKSLLPITFEGDSPRSIVAILFDKKGTKYLVGEKEIFSQYTDYQYNKIAFSSAVPMEKDIISDAEIINGQLWVLMNNANIFIFELYKNKVSSKVEFKNKFKGLNPLIDPNCILQTNDSTVWIGSRSGGAIMVDLNSKSYINTITSNNKNDLKRPFILSLFSDKDNGLWLGLSGGGVAKYDQDKFAIDRWSDEPEKSKTKVDNMIFSMLRISKNEMLLGTLYGGVSLLNLDTRLYQYFKPDKAVYNFAESNSVYNIVPQGSGKYWLSARGGVYLFDLETGNFQLFTDPDDLQTTEISAMILLKDKRNLLLGSYNGGLRMFDIVEKKFKSCPDENDILNNTSLRVRYMVEEEDGKIVLSTESKSLCKYNYLTGIFTFYPQFGNISGTSRYFYKDKDYRWIATDDGLIQSMQMDNTVVKLWTTQDGLPNNVIYSIQVDKNKKVWVSTNSGLAVIDPVNGQVESYTEDDGLQAMEYNTAVTTQDVDGKIWFGGINGINSINPNQAKKSNNCPKPTLTQIDVMNSPHQDSIAIPFIQNLVLPHTKNFIRFEFRALKYTNQSKILYKYKLTNVDTSWVMNGTRNYANYTLLNPGKYKFMISASHSNMQWSEPKIVDITILPPFYRTWWFYVLATFSLGLITFTSLRYRIRTFKEKTRMTERMHKTELEALKAQMNPHFIFNSLNSINSFIVQSKTHLASDYLTKFSRLIRLILDNSKNESISLAKEIETLKLYLLMESLRFDNAFAYTIDISSNINVDIIEVPPMVIQPYIENAIWHGLLQKRDKRELLLKFYLSSFNTELCVEIVDNGIGRKKAMEVKSKSGNINKSYGMDITRERLLSLNNKNHVHIEDSINAKGKPSGTKVTLSFTQQLHP